MRAVLRRVRAYAGNLGLLAALTLVAALIAAGVPRLANHYTDEGLRSDVGGLSWEARDLIFATNPDETDGIRATAGDGFRQLVSGGLPAPIPGFVEDSWFRASVEAPGTTLSGPAPYNAKCRPTVRALYQTGAAAAVRMVEGRLPKSASRAEAVVTAEAAALAGLKVGTTLTVATEYGTAALRIVGVYQPLDSASPQWAGTATERISCPAIDDGFTWRATALTDAAGAELAGRETALLRYQWRYRLRAEALTAPDIEPLTTAIVQARREPPRDYLSLSTGLDRELTVFAGRLHGARATVAVVQAGLIVTVAGLMVLAALLMADRRRAEQVLLRARGASSGRTAARALAEAALVGIPAVALGRLAASLLPGRAGDSEVLLLGVLLLLAVGVPAFLAARPPAGGGRAVARPGLRRTTAEIFLLLLTGLGVVLVRRRGLQNDTDPFLSVVPVLLGASAALLVVRLTPAPLRLAGRLAARGRGAVGFLGLARAGRGSTVSAGPLAVLVVAAATGIFTAAVSTTIDDARDRATDRSVAADARLSGYSFQPGTETAIARVPGVEAAAPLLTYAGVRLLNSRGSGSDSAQLIIVDGTAATEVARRSGVREQLPAALSETRTAEPLPAVVSPDVAAEIGPTGVVYVQGHPYDFRVAEVTDALPLLDAGARRYIALPWRAIPVLPEQPLIPTEFLLAGTGYDPARVLSVADAGQREYYLGVLRRTIGGDAVTEVSDAMLPRRAALTTWGDHRSALQDNGVNALLSFVFTAGAAGSAALALLAVGLAVLAGAPARGRALSRLRTLGLSRRQGRNLLILELTPLLAVAFLAGTLVGWALPQLLGPVLGLDAFTAGVGASPGVGWGLALRALALLVAGVVSAVVVESLAHRRMGLGQSLRLGEES
ncbi:FtsX-like permease family protein [Symbioplanes lichenis]|uniref:FtsX-like permease family protein n=1 Tax=Symbioplanes lichenis TaxID=1629072 RepID=UPI00273A2556|nr:FtsX-like permease family protein [Actinoplanes lichenis]